MKIDFDKYYAPIEIVNYCYDRVVGQIGKDNISEIVDIIRQRFPSVK